MNEAEPNTVTAEIGAPVVADPAWMRGSEAPAPASLANQLVALRNAAGEADALAAVTVAWFDEGNWSDVDPLLVDPLAVPLLVQRAAELDRIIAEYASDAIAELAAPASSFTGADHAWVRDHAATSLAEIEAATLRLVAFLHVAQPVSRGSTARDGAGVAEPVVRPTRVAPMMPSDHGSHRCAAVSAGRVIAEELAKRGGAA